MIKILCLTVLFKIHQCNYTTILLQYFSFNPLTLSVPGGLPTVIHTHTGWFSFKSYRHHCFCKDLQHHNSPVDWARELFKPSMVLESLLV